MRFINRDEFKKYILRKLGAGINTIVPDQLTMDQLNDAIDDTIIYFQRHHYDGSRRRTMIIPKDHDRQTEYILPDNILSVNDILHGRYTYFSSASSSNSPAYDDYLLYGRQSGTGLASKSSDGQSITPYYIQEQAYNTFTDVYLPKPSYTFSVATHKLILQSSIDRRNFLDFSHALYLDVMEIISEEDNPDIYNNEWVREYAIATVGVQWGENITRYENVALPGGSKSNGKDILQRYLRKQENLLEELEQLGYAPMIYIG